LRLNEKSESVSCMLWILSISLDIKSEFSSCKYFIDNQWLSTLGNIYLGYNMDHNVHIIYSKDLLPINSFLIFFYYCAGGMLWHLQKFFQYFKYIMVSFLMIFCWVKIKHFLGVRKLDGSWKFENKIKKRILPWILSVFLSRYCVHRSLNFSFILMNLCPKEQNTGHI
jgi:hypothetical protein